MLLAKAVEDQRTKKRSRSIEARRSPAAGNPRPAVEFQYSPRSKYLQDIWPWRCRRSCRSSWACSCSSAAGLRNAKAWPSRGCGSGRREAVGKCGTPWRSAARDGASKRAKRDRFRSVQFFQVICHERIGKDFFDDRRGGCSAGGGHVDPAPAHFDRVGRQSRPKPVSRLEGRRRGQKPGNRQRRRNHQLAERFQSRRRRRPLGRPLARQLSRPTRRTKSSRLRRASSVCKCSRW